MNTKKSFRIVFMSAMLALVMCAMSISTFAAASTVATTAPSFGTQEANASATPCYDEEEGMYYIELQADVVAPANANSQTYMDNVTVLSEAWYGSEMTCNYSLLTASARGDSSGHTITIKLKKYNAIVGYVNVSGSERTLVCDGQTHNIYTSLAVTRGAKYRFYYSIANGSLTDSVGVTLAAVFWDR